MKQTLTIGIKEILEKAFIFSRVLSHGNDYLIVELTGMRSNDIEQKANYKFDGVIFLSTIKGEFNIEKRYDTIRLKEKSLMTIFPDEEIHGLKNISNDKALITGLFLTRTFIRDLNFNLNVFTSLNPLGVKPSVIRLTDMEFDMLTKYFSLLEINARNRTSEINDVLTRNIARNLVASLFYNLLLVTRDNARAETRNVNSRKTAYVFEFMDLLQNNYKTHRTVKYYADRMCITPKYLSLLIKEMTGKSAAEWIDECVILEAKNLLRFSGMNVQQVAYELNFPNQSAFGKYFKHILGISPSSFQQT